jgi:hypothetical protein
MGVRFPSAITNVQVGIYGAAGTEVVVLTTPPLTLPLDFAQVFLIWYVVFNCGTGTTGVQKRLRRGPALLSTAFDAGGIVAVTANTIVSLSGCLFDTPGAAAGQQYSLTLAGTATTGAAGYIDGCLMAFCL